MAFGVKVCKEGMQINYRANALLSVLGNEFPGKRIVAGCPKFDSHPQRRRQETGGTNANFRLPPRLTSDESPIHFGQTGASLKTSAQTPMAQQPVSVTR